MNKLNNSFKVFFDNIVKPFVKKENSRNYKMDYADGSYNSFKALTTLGEINYSDPKRNKIIKISDKDKALFECNYLASSDSSFSSLNTRNSYKKVREIEGLKEYSFFVNDKVSGRYMFVKYFPNGGKVYVTITDSSFNILVDYLEVPKKIIKYLGSTGTAGDGAWNSPFEYYCFLGYEYETIPGGSKTRYQYIFLNRLKLFSDNPQTILQAFEEAKEYRIDNSTLGEGVEGEELGKYKDYSNLTGEYEGPQSGFVSNSYSHGILYIVRFIEKRTEIGTFNGIIKAVGTVIDFVKNEEGTDVVMNVSERVLTELPTFNADSYGHHVPRVAIADTSSYYSNKPGVVTIFHGKKLYVSGFPRVDNGTAITTVPSFTEYTTAAEGDFQSVVNLGRNYNTSYDGVFLVADSYGNIYTYSTSYSTTVTLLKSKDETKKYHNFNQKSLKNFNDIWITDGGYITRDLVTWYPLSQKISLPNGNYIEGKEIYELNINKLISVEADKYVTWIKYDLLYNNSNYYQKKKPVSKLTFFYTQNEIPMLNTISFSIEDDNKYYINNNNY